MTADLYEQPQFNNGEGINFADFNSVVRNQTARITDQMLERMTGYLAANGDPDLWPLNSDTAAGNNGDDTKLSSLIYTLTGGDCELHQGSTNTRLAVGTGTILHKAGGSGSGESSLIPFYVSAGSEPEFVIAAGDATHPRIDILQVKLEWVSGDNVGVDFKDAVTGALTTQNVDKLRSVDATFSIKQGTPAATPTYPTPDAGYAVLGAVRVPTSWAANISADSNGSANAVYRQCSVPLRIEAITMNACEFDYSKAVNWSLNANGEAESGGAATDLYIWCPRAGQTKRVVGIDLIGVWVTSGQVLLENARWNGLTHFSVAADGKFDLSSQLVSTGGLDKALFAHLGDIADASPDSNPSAAAGPIGDPVWAVGLRSGPGFRKIHANGGGLSGSTWFSRTRLNIDAANLSVVVAATWYLAG